MSVKLRCMECNTFYLCSKENTKIYGTIIETTCSKCKNKTISNLSAFAMKQMDNGNSLLISHATNSIALNTEIEQIIENEKAFKKKK